ncbi:MAG: bifunctional ornithine acetyltransferase/N-acetylglutamate synthase, partial [Alphaproteobacteria bacterium]
MAELTKSPLAPTAFPTLSNIDGVELLVAPVGFKYKDRLDFFVAKICDGASVSGAFTKSLTRSSAVDYSRAVIKNGNVKAIAVNSGNSNAFTGVKGEKANEVLANETKRLTSVDGDVVTCSTGVIGEVLDTTKLESLSELKSGSWLDCATAIGTTDTFEKGAGKTCKIGDKTVNISGIAKGSGMIAPDMATMLAYIFTDANIEQSKLDELIVKVTNKSFNSITVDGDTSTSDSVVLVATGKAGNDTNDDLTEFETALGEVFIDLAQQIVKDGEGATKFITVNVTGAKTSNCANLVANSIANSPLVKTAIAG